MIFSGSISKAEVIRSNVSKLGVRNSCSIKLIVCLESPAFSASKLSEQPRFSRSFFKRRATSEQIISCILLTGTRNPYAEKNLTADATFVASIPIGLKSSLLRKAIYETNQAHSWQFGNHWWTHRVIESRPRPNDRQRGSIRQRDAIGAGRFHRQRCGGSAGIGIGAAGSNTQIRDVLGRFRRTTSRPIPLSAIRSGEHSGFLAGH